MIWILLGGLLGGFSFPTAMGSVHFPELGFLAWVALIPLYLRLKKASIWQGFYSGLVFGAGLYGISLYWIFIAMFHYGQVPVWGSLLGVIVMVFLLSLYLGAALLLAIFLAKKTVPLFVTLPLAWVTQDFLKNYFPFGGFPWSSLGYTQHHFLTLLQMLDLTGIYGVTFFIIVINQLLAELFLWLRTQRAFPLRESLCLVSLLFLVLLYGKIKISTINHFITIQPKIRVSLIQGNIPQDAWRFHRVSSISIFLISSSGHFSLGR
ncbi:MAG: hypothetical protein HY073_00100 [Deltaproteobacteria bacterium]|nr:hypothetical protein [Deltaproteobacteria bacterium]